MDATGVSGIWLAVTFRRKKMSVSENTLQTRSCSQTSIETHTDCAFPFKIQTPGQQHHLEVSLWISELYSRQSHPEELLSSQRVFKDLEKVQILIISHKNCSVERQQTDNVKIIQFLTIRSVWTTVTYILWGTLWESVTVQYSCT